MRRAARTEAPAVANGHSKYRNKPTGEYSSKREARRAAELILMLGAEVQRGTLVRQVRYELVPAQYLAGKCVERSVVYVADFVYRDRNGNLVVEDVKGVRTPAYIIKRKLMLHVHGIRIRET